ncbi:MAG: sigma-70 family RNA polymerase sigma factor [Aquincola sp.]|nr:sigma-70 family RNA polymerase sigma factor [Aquincola sp.]
MTPLEQELSMLHKPLLRFAKLQLRDEAAAEDAVSATLLAILEKPDAFKGGSSLRTYATGILKHKVVDQIRRCAREVSIEPLEDQSIDEAIEAMFDETGHWRDEPASWVEPERAVEQSQMMTALERCIETLPDRLGRVFMMREWLENDTSEICEELNITANNCHVMLFRARMLLRACFDASWFQRGPT